jgi:DNA-binding transcriptional regulator YiaG
MPTGIDSDGVASITVISHFGKFIFRQYRAAFGRGRRMRKSQHTGEYHKLLQALRAAREAVGLTQGQVARRLGTYASFVSKCESGERRLDVLELVDLCRLYKLDPVELLRSAGILHEPRKGGPR